MTVDTFESAPERTAQENLDLLVSTQKKLTRARGQQWGAPGWPYVSVNARGKRCKETLWFDVKRSPKPSLRGTNPFSPHFYDHVRAFVSRAIDSRGGSAHITLITRYIDALGYLARSAGSNIEFLDLLPAHFTAAEKLMNTERTGGTPARIAAVLQDVADTINRLVMPLQWKKTLKEAQGSSGRRAKVGEEFESRRDKKLPSIDVMTALGQLSSRNDLPLRDLLRIRVLDLAVAGGFRISEVLSLPRDTLIKTPILNEYGQPVLDENGKPEFSMGLRYWPAKGGHAVNGVKAIPVQYRSMVQRAIDDVLRITEPYADLARYMRANPGRTRLGAPWDSMPDDARIALRDVGRIVRVPTALRDDIDPNDMKHDVRLAMNTVGVPLHRIRDPSTRKVRYSEEYVLKGDLVSVYAARSDHDMNVLSDSIGTLCLEDSLFVVPKQFFTTRYEYSVCPLDVTCVSYQAIKNMLSKSKKNKENIFDKYGIKDSKGNPLSANTHQFRHLMDTMMAQGGLSEMERAYHAGRAKITQNSSYNHVPGRVLAKQVLEKLNKSQVIGPNSDQLRRINDPISREDFAKAVFGGTAHYTELGMCIHDWSASPCEHHGEHVHCQDHLICKGKPEHRAEAERQLEANRWLVEMARKERAIDTYGADDWLEHHERTCARLEKVISIHRSNMIPDGFLVQLTMDGEVVLTEEMEATFAAA